MPEFDLSNEDYSADEQLYQILSIMDHFLIEYKHQFFVDKLLLFFHNLFYYQGEKIRYGSHISIMKTHCQLLRKLFNDGCRTLKKKRCQKKPFGFRGTAPYSGEYRTLLRNLYEV
jgi:hypothetical protein